ncbi:MAG: glucose-6-phosphate isomerase [Bacteroidales bacterium]|jgi:glucose-6-phosphate isomerase|nr:glucose-6-phosphate isomerase [Bacteroidales bacterium]
MKNIEIHLNHLSPFIDKGELENYQALVKEKVQLLKERTGKGSDFLGWMELPQEISKQEIDDLKKTASDLQKKSDTLVVIGIGGSYLGAKAVIEALSGHFHKKKHTPEIVFAGNNLSQDYHYELSQYLKDKSFSIIVISKSGTTTEPAIAFRILRKQLEEKVGKEETQKRIVAITDAEKGALKTLATQENYKTFTIADNIGGRYSVFTPVGLLPIACAGFNIDELIDGAKAMLELSNTRTFDQNPVYQYAAIRHLLYTRGKKIEILANYDLRLNYIAEWWKQLFGESEGKEHQGIFPASVNFTTDLHSMGQYIQDGVRNLFETVLSVEQTHFSMKIPADPENFDKLNYLAGKPMDFINKMAETGTTLAHVDGGVPNIRISIPKLNEWYIGELLYLFEKSCAISGYLLGINPFDQPGVEAYKKNMFALLGKPGFEEETEKIKHRITKNTD